MTASGTGIPMGATTYSNVVFGGATGQPATGSRAPDMPAKFGQVASRFFRPGREVVSEAIPVFFIGRAYAIHGDIPVPLQAVSHGCVRIPMDVAGFFHRQIPISETAGKGAEIYIWGQT